MKRLMTIAAVLLTAMFAVPAAAQALKVMSFNVRTGSAKDGADEWPNRRDLMARTIRRAAPDLIGTQELEKAQGEDLAARLPGYSWFGRDRRGGHGDEHMGIFYRRDRLTLLKTGDFWLSDTPDVVGSVTWGHPLPRMVTWARFRDRSGRVFTHYNTHLPYRAEDEEARIKGATLIAQRVAALPRSMPLVLTGDFNTGADSAAHATLAKVLTDTRAAVPPKGPEGTFHGFKGTPGKDRIDWIMIRGFRVRTAATLTDHDGARYPSDHFPAVATLEFD